MDDRDITLALAADLRALLPVVRHHITMLSTPATASQDPTAGSELARLTSTMATSCAQSEADDCALLLCALYDRCATSSEALQPRFAALVWDALAYVQERVEAMGALVAPRTPTDAQRAHAERLARSLAGELESGTHDAETSTVAASSGWFPRPEAARDASMGEPSLTARTTAPLVYDGPDHPENDDEALSENDLALVQSFLSSPLRHARREAPPSSASERRDHATAPLPPPGTGERTDGDIVVSDTGTLSPVSQPSGAAKHRLAPTAEELDYIPPEIKQQFLTDTVFDVQDLRQALTRYGQRPDDIAALATMGRIAHKIKGAAATLGFEALASVLHGFEDVIRAVQSRRVVAGIEAGAALERAMGLVEAALDMAGEHSAMDDDASAAVIAQARQLFDGLLISSAAEIGADRSPPVAEQQPEIAAAPLVGAHPVATAGENASESYLRVDVRRLDELMRHISALAVNRAALTQTREDVVRLQGEMDQALAKLSEISGHFSDLQPLLRAPARDLGAGSGKPGAESGNSRPRFFGAGSAAQRLREADGGDREVSGVGGGTLRWDTLELEQFTELDHAQRKLNEVIADVDTTSRQFRALLLRLSQLSEEQSALATRMQRDVMHVRLVPLNSIVARLEVETRLLSQQVGKTVVFSVRGEMTEIDRNIADALAGPLLLLVRNAVVHGIELADERRELGKPAAGQLWMHAYYVGSEVIIEIGDDGGGINPTRIAASAMALDIIPPEAVRTVSTAEALELMFMPGVTSFNAAQTVGGRGIGLDDVRKTIHALKGSVTVHSEQGRGTVFRIRVPISLSIVHVLRVEAAGQQYAVPFSAVQRTLSLSASEVIVSVPYGSSGDGTRGTAPQRRIRIERTDTAPVVGEFPEDQRYEEIPVFALAELLGVDHSPRDPQMALLVEVARQRVALLVDDVNEDLEVVVQALAPHLRRRALRGASVTPNGQLLLLLDLPELISGVLNGTQARPALRPRPARAVVLAPRVLIVDDSISIRRALEHTLRRSGFEVDVARDGIEALELMLAATPRVVVLDIEMPRLDGFELLSILRETPQFAGVRVAMLTSRAADKHREHAQRLGVEAYLVKPCPQETLVETVRMLLAEPVEPRER